jgi:hypothetical protein
MLQLPTVSTYEMLRSVRQYASARGIAAYLRGKQRRMMLAAFNQVWSWL